MTLWRAVDGLVNPRQVKLFRDDGTADWTTVPPLWAQLQGAVGTGSRRGARSSSRAWTPLDLECMELAASIRETIVDALSGHDEQPLRDGLPVERLDVIRAQRRAERTYGLYMVELTPLPPAGRVLVPASLRHLASVVTATNDDDLIGWWVYRVTSWSRQIVHVLQLEEAPQPRRIRDTSCPECQASHVTLVGLDGPERVPALLIDFTDGYVRAASCTACGASWFRGQSLVDLADLIEATRRTVPAFTNPVDHVI